MDELTDREALQLLNDILPRLLPDERAMRALIWVQRQLAGRADK